MEQNQITKVAWDLNEQTSNRYELAYHIADLAKRMIDETNCDAVMIGRGVLGNPWLIKQCIDYLDYGIEPEKITIEEKISMLKKHAEMLFESKPEKVAIAKVNFRDFIQHII